MQDASELGEQKDMCLFHFGSLGIDRHHAVQSAFFEEEGILDIPRNGRDAVSSTARKWKNFWGWFALSILD